MKKLLLSLVVALLLTGCSGKGYSLNLPEGWTVQEETSKNIVLQGPEEGKEPITVRIYHKDPNNSLPFWILENNLELNSTYNGQCGYSISSENSDALNCGPSKAEYYLVSRKGDMVLVLFQGEQTIVNLEEFQKMFTFL